MTNANLLQIPPRSQQEAGGYIGNVDPAVTIATVGRMSRVGPFTIPIPTYNAAYAALDTFGNPFSFAVPPYGAIVGAQFYDLAYQNLGKELWLSDRPIVTFTADNAQFTLADADSISFQGVITFAVFKDAVNNSQGISADLPLWYFAPAGVLYGIFKTLGADTIATASVNPLVGFTIEAYGGPN